MGECMKLGIKDQDRETIAQHLSKILADTFVLSVKTQGFHWNVKGPHFYALHKLFEEQYDALQDALDPLAERLRALGVPAPGAIAAYAKLTSLKEQDKIPAAQAMVKELLQDNEALALQIHATINAIEGTQDEVTADMLTERLERHEKAAWMLRSTLED